METGVFPGLQSRVCPGKPGQVGSTPTHLRHFILPYRMLNRKKNSHIFGKIVDSEYRYLVRGNRLSFCKTTSYRYEAWRWYYFC